MSTDEEEVSLIDLVSVLLKRRRMILWGTAVSLLVGLGLQFASSAYLQTKPDLRLLSMELTPLINPQVQNAVSALDISLLAYSYAQEPDYFMKALQRRGYAVPQVPPMAVEAVQKGGKFNLVVKIRTEDPEEGAIFLRTVQEDLDERVRTALLELKLIQAPIPVFAAPGGVSDTTKKPMSPALGAVFGFGAFFATILLAFMAEYAQRLRSDPEAMAKIRRAMEK